MVLFESNTNMNTIVTWKIIPAHNFVSKRIYFLKINVLISKFIHNKRLRAYRYFMYRRHVLKAHVPLMVKCLIRKSNKLFTIDNDLGMAFKPT